MNSPFQNTDGAFEVFYDEEVVVSLKDGSKQTLTVSIFDIVEGDVLMDEGSMDTTRTDIRLTARKKDWCFLKSLKRGDILECRCRGKYTVSEVKNDPYFGIVITARESK